MAALTNEKTISIPNSTGRSIQDVDWRNSKVSWDHNKRAFTLHVDKLEPSDFETGKIKVFVTTQKDSSGLMDARNENFAEIELDIRIPELDSQQAKAKWNKNIQKLVDFSPLIDSLVAQYQAIFKNYSLEHAIASKLPVKQSEVAPGPDFSQFYNCKNIPTDASLKIASNDDNKEDEPSIVTTFPVHKFALFSTSTKMEEELGNETALKIKGVAAETLGKFAEYLYTKKVKLESDAEAWELYQLGKSYEIEHLQAVCLSGAYRESMRRAAPEMLTSPQGLREILTEAAGVADINQVYIDASARIANCYQMFLSFNH